MDKAQIIAFLQNKGFALTGRWDDLWEEAHAHAKTIAGEAKIELLEDVFNHLEKGMAKGKNRALIAQEMAEMLAKKGWYYGYTGGAQPLGINYPDVEQVIKDSTKGSKQRKQLLKDYAPNKHIPELTNKQYRGNLWRLKLIARQNSQSAYMAGAYRRQIANIKNRPYWQYLAVIDPSTRDSHRALHGKVYRADDPIWDTVYPPNGFNCRCRVSALSERDMKRLGLEVTHAELEREQLPKRNRDGSPRYRYHITPNNDRSVGAQPRFTLDDGFAYNAGKIQARPFIPRMGEVTAENVHLLERVADSKAILPDDLTPEQYASAFLAEFGIKRGEVKAFTDATGDVIPISEDLLTARKKDKAPYLKADKAGRGRYMKILAQTFKDPDEIWLSWEKEKGVWHLKRHYLRVMDLGNNLVALGVFRRENGVWYGSTIFQYHSDKDAEKIIAALEEKRQGVRLYQRENN
ncbi:MAG: hypothetical protein CR974_03835 [Gammaproteobacteria bacterium]|nr:MAG: hypothetical protein CR974_03835 [Gammaproteobacteria bacterium]